MFVLFVCCLVDTVSSNSLYTAAHSVHLAQYFISVGICTPRSRREERCDGADTVVESRNVAESRNVRELLHD